MNCRWDYSTSIPELMQALDTLVKSNKVLYLGISDTPGKPSVCKDHMLFFLTSFHMKAWLVVKANEYARAHGMAQFVVCTYLCNTRVALDSHTQSSADQGLWSIGTRDLEREIVPMCRAEGMGVVPWGILGQVRLTAVVFPKMPPADE